MKINKKITLLSAAVLALPIAYTISCGTPVEYNDDNKIPPLDINNRPESFDVVMTGDYAPYNFTLSSEQHRKIELQSLSDVDLPDDGGLDPWEADAFLEMSNSVYENGVDGEVYVGGYDVAVAKEIGKDKLKIHISPFENLLPTVAAGNADAAIDGITVTDERKSKEGVEFSHEYLRARNGLLYNKKVSIEADPDLVIDFDHLDGKRIGVEKNSIQEEILENLQSTKFHSMEIERFTSVSGAFLPTHWDPSSLLPLDGFFCEDMVADLEMDLDRPNIGTPEQKYEMVDFNTQTEFNNKPNNIAVAVKKGTDLTKINEAIDTFTSKDDFGQDHTSNPKNDTVKGYSELFAAWVRDTKGMWEPKETN